MPTATRTPLNPGEHVDCPVCFWGGAIAETHLTDVGPHLKAECPECGRYLKFVKWDATWQRPQ